MTKVIKIIKKILLVIGLLLILLIITWRIDRAFFHPYIPDYQDQIRSDVTTIKFKLPKEKTACEEMSGVWKKMGPRPVEECNLATKDAGKECLSSNVCEGVCLAELTPEQMRKGMSGKMFKISGKCSNWVKVIGCAAYVYQGWASVVCLD